jgi:hypothetical protein
MAPAKRKRGAAAAAAAAAKWKVGDLVLAKMKGFPAWPAMVSSCSPRYLPPSAQSVASWRPGQPLGPGDSGSVPVLPCLGSQTLVRGLRCCQFDQISISEWSAILI